MASSIKAIATSASSPATTTTPVSPQSHSPPQAIHFPFNQTSLPKKVAQHWPEYQSVKQTAKRSFTTSAGTMATSDNNTQPNEASSPADNAETSNQSPVVGPEHREMRIKLPYGHLAAKVSPNSAFITIHPCLGWIFLAIVAPDDPAQFPPNLIGFVFTSALFSGMGQSWWITRTRRPRLAW